MKHWHLNGTDYIWYEGYYTIDGKRIYAIYRKEVFQGYGYKLPRGAYRVRVTQTIYWD